MPIEIRELIIRATVDPGGSGGDGAGGAGRCGPAPDKSTPGAEREAASAQADSLVQACVREVLRILDAKAER